MTNTTQQIDEFKFTHTDRYLTASFNTSDIEQLSLFIQNLSNWVYSKSGAMLKLDDGKYINWCHNNLPHLTDDTRFVFRVAMNVRPVDCEPLDTMIAQAKKQARNLKKHRSQLQYSLDDICVLYSHIINPANWTRAMGHLIYLNAGPMSRLFTVGKLSHLNTHTRLEFFRAEHGYSDHFELNELFGAACDTAIELHSNK